MQSIINPVTNQLVTYWVLINFQDRIESSQKKTSFGLMIPASFVLTNNPLHLFNAVHIKGILQLKSHFYCLRQRRL